MVKYCDHGMRIASGRKAEDVLPQYETIVSPRGYPQSSAFDGKYLAHLYHKKKLALSASSSPLKPFLNFSGQSAAVAAEGHWPVPTDKRQRCKQRTPKCCWFSSFKCFQCRKHFCIRKSTNCFTDFHRIHSNIKFPTHICQNLDHAGNSVPIVTFLVRKFCRMSLFICV